MSDLVLAHLQYIRSAVDETHREMDFLIVRLDKLQAQFTGVDGELAGLCTQSMRLSERMDRVDARLERIERRIGPIDA